MKSSSVECPRLISCEAHEEALKSILSWPVSLKELHYHADQGESTDHFKDLPENWIHDALIRCLESQKTTLRELTLTRPPAEDEELYTGSPVDVHDFGPLTTLTIFHVFLSGSAYPLDVRKTLPRSLEVLEVYYDNPGFFDVSEEYEGRMWLMELLRGKEEHFPNLIRVEVHSPDDDVEDPPGFWLLPPPNLAKQAGVAGVEVRVWQGDGPFPECDEFT